MRRLFAIAVIFTAGCGTVPQPPCAKHRCDPSIDEQFKRNASWDARTPDEYERLKRTH
ncbi:hypothetical protein [Hyphomicrobium sp.]|jgi:hypothetical protein|uniref:hypothetical protein n=1 Tax=Hyphomicrobium sp. TaxID=82 RepID=UPI002C07B90F|nr:hypothetical protein [Hyphomicrobium sp.]HVZ03807.1 hypothetical protein [Hyphomicrobium sp.]